MEREEWIVAQLDGGLRVWCRDWRRMEARRERARRIAAGITGAVCLGVGVAGLVWLVVASY